MNFQDIWNYIVSQYKKKYTSLETVVQSSWMQYFSELFNYRQLFGEIDAQRVIQIGSGKSAIPDIIINVDGTDLFDVELKQYSLPFSIEMENQLKSYMDLLHISVGILICQRIYVYIYDFSQSKFKKAEIQFTENNPDGIKLVELLQKGNFSAQSIEDFIDSKRSFNDNVNKIKQEVTAKNVFDLVKEHFESIYSKDEVDAALKSLSIEIKSTQNVHPNKPLESIPASIAKDASMDYSKYIFRGTAYGKSRLVLAVVSAYVQDHPTVTYNELKMIFHDKLQGSTGVIATPQEAMHKRTDPEKRYFTKNPINLINGQIWVCTQWGIGNIDYFINKALSLGYNIDKVS